MPSPKSPGVNKWAATKLISDPPQLVENMPLTVKFIGKHPLSHLHDGEEVLRKKESKETPFSSCLRNASSLGYRGKLHPVRLWKLGSTMWKQVAT